MKIVVYEEFERDLNLWKEQNERIVEKIQKLLEAIAKDPFKGIGKLEPLKYQLSGCWSRRINKEHRLVYRVQNEELQLISCRYHYS